MNDYLTTTEAATLAHVSQNYIRRLAKDGRLASKRIGQTILVKRADVLLYRAQADKYNASKGKYKATETTK